MNLGHWTYDGDVPIEAFGFIYEITGPNGKKYIGKKQMQTKQKRPPLKGKKRKRIRVVETKWREYTGSSEMLNESIDTEGKDSFTFEILRFCTCKWELAYYEAELQFAKGVLLTDDYYNGIINCRIGRPPKSVKEG